MKNFRFGKILTSKKLWTAASRNRFICSGSVWWNVVTSWNNFCDYTTLSKGNCVFHKGTSLQITRDNCKVQPHRQIWKFSNTTFELSCVYTLVTLTQVLMTWHFYLKQLTFMSRVFTYLIYISLNLLGLKQNTLVLIFVRMIIRDMKQ